MNLSLKQKALLNTVTLMGSALLGGFAVSLMFIYFSVTTIFTIIGVAGFGYLMYIVYAINLSQLESQERLKEMTEKRG